MQFRIGQSSKFSAAFWYPVDGNAWHGSGHYTISCDWVGLDVAYPQHGSSASSDSYWDVSSAFAFLISLLALGVSICVAYWVHNKKNTIPFTRVDVDPL